MTLPKEVRIREVGPREGVQTSDARVATSDKVELIAKLSRTGVKDIEITSLVRADKVPQMADAEEVIKTFTPVPGVRYTALYLNTRGFERAEDLGRLSNKGWLNIAASETFLKKNSNTTVAEALDKIPEFVAALNRYNKQFEGVMLSTAFVCGYEGLIAAAKANDVITQVKSRVEGAGHCVHEICLADTVGRANPSQVRALIDLVRATHPEMEISLHLHDTMGLGLANAYAGLLEGVQIFDGSVGGVGGCPFMKGASGNIATEDLVYLCHELGIETGISLERYVEAARFASQVFQRELPGKVHKVIRP